jgi:YceI-like domain
MTRPAMTGEVASPVLPGDWVADPAACTLAFAVRNFGLRTVTGQIPLTRADVSVGPSGQPDSIRAKLDARGIRTGNPRRDNDLRGRRFLATDRWPVITFEAAYIKPVQNRLDGKRKPHRQGHPVPGAARRRQLHHPGGWPGGSGRPARDRPPGPPLGRRDRRAGLPHRSPDLALAGGAAPAAGRTAAALTFSDIRSFICSPI